MTEPAQPYNVYRREREPKARRRWPYVLGAVACVLAALLAWQLLGVPRVSAVTPGPDSYVKDASPRVVLDVHGLSRLDDVRVTLDGDDVTAAAERDGDTLTLAAASLADGSHAVVFSATSHNLFRHRVEKSWAFTVDTGVPELQLSGSAEEGRINTSPATFAGTTEPFSTVRVTSGTLAASGAADMRGLYAVSIPLPDGPSDVVIATVDRAGNTTTKRLAVFVDAVPPTLKVTKLAKVIEHPGLRLRINAQDQLGTPTVVVTLDGKERETSGALPRTALLASSLAQGRHTVSVRVSDQGGNVVTDTQTFIVDSTEHFGSAVLWPGARGADVRELQSRLAAAGTFGGQKNGLYDKRTATAVEKFQEKFGLEVDGIVGGRVLSALSGQIIVDLGDLRLYLYRDGKLVKSYAVAAGQPKYPTPTGTYAVVNMKKDPTWLPPNSDWAKDAKPIPPGVDNPLGTRWIGTSAPGVGIHGTPDDASIGSYASHGCIRMHIWDVEDLFERVAIGMPVIIRL
jgi:lipoprotein-anchoring transpeptidase ErfK/SrfK